jgi:hypothetical protein
MKATRTIVLVVIVSSFACGQRKEPSPNPSELLEQVRARLMPEMSRQSRYSCVQNVTRHFYDSGSKMAPSCANHSAGRTGRDRPSRANSVEHFQFDVAIAGNREIHAWPGAPSFAEEEIRQAAGNGGAFGSGDFAAFIVNVFGGSAAIKFDSIRHANGRVIFDYTFDVPQSASNYAIANSAEAIVLGYGGSFSLDSQSADLLRLTVRTSELPAATDACQATSTIAYQRVGIHGQNVLIPLQTDLDTVFRDGAQADSVTSYSSCHEYSTSAVMRFDVADAATNVKSSEPAEKSVADPFPLGSRFDCRIVTPIDAETPAGSPLEGRLLAPILGDSGEMLAPAGARVRGRLVRLAEYQHPRHYFEADVRLDTIEVNGLELRIYAVLNRRATPPTGRGQPARWSGLADFAANAPLNVGAFFFMQKRLNVPGWDSAWATTMPEASSRGRGTERPRAESSEQALGSQAASSFLSAIRYARASDLLKPESGATHLEENPRLADILSYRRKALEAGQAADADQLNDMYPGLGDRFRSQFLNALTLFVHSCEIRSQSADAAKEELSRSTLLYDEWLSWYEPLHKDIEDAVGSRAPRPAAQQQ